MPTSHVISQIDFHPTVGLIDHRNIGYPEFAVGGVVLMGALDFGDLQRPIAFGIITDGLVYPE